MSVENDGIWFQNVNELYEYKEIRSLAISSIFQQFQASDSNEGSKYIFFTNIFYFLLLKFSFRVITVSQSPCY